MAKGDTVDIIYTAGPSGWVSVRVMATKAGRSVKVERTPRVTKVLELTRTGREAGHTVTIPTANVACIEQKFLIKEAPSRATKTKPTL